MSAETKAGFGMGGTIGWTVGAAVSGVVAAAVFGATMWLFEPDVVAAAIPAIYGFDPSTAFGMTIHLFHGAVLGLLFGLFVTRPVVLGVLRTNVETEAISELGLALRVVTAGFVFGVAIWAILPLIVLPMWVEVAGAADAAMFPAFAVESMLGHMVFGLVLGLVFAVVVDLYDRPAVNVLEE